MNYVDQQLVRLADPATRTTVFDQAALEQIVAAAYDSDAMSVTGPFAATFAEFRLGVAASSVAAFDGTWNPVGGVDKAEAHFRLAGLGDGGFPRVDGLWRGAITARFSRAGDRVTSVVTAVPDARTVDARVTFAEPQPVSPTVAELPLAGAVLVRDAAGLSLAELLTESKSVRERLRAYAVERPPDPTLRMREPLVVVWVVPAAVFDDGDWPGGGAGTPAERRDARRLAAGAWLAREGIGLAATL